jgi:hypothetical protein
VAVRQTSASRSRRRAIRPTTAPSLASAKASAAPTPDEAPVMSTRFPAAENTTAPGWPRTSTYDADLGIPDNKSTFDG